MHLKRRRLVITALTTAALVIGGVAAASPADAATGSYRLYLKHRVIDGYSQATIIRGSGASGDTLKTGSLWYGSSKAPKGKITLQRKVSKKWVTIKKAKATSRGVWSAALPAYTVPAAEASHTVKYRFKSSKSSKARVRNTDYSATFTVKYLNPSHYTGFAATFYNYLAPYCPTTAVEVRGDLTESTGGQFVGLYQWQRGISVDPSVASYSAPYQQGVALHECAHYHEMVNFGNSATGWSKMEKKAATIFVNDVNPATGQPDSPVASDWTPVEHAADCASHSVQPAGYLGYGGYCNPTELTDGYALLVQGQKF